MKKYFTLILIAFSSLFFAESCKKTAYPPEMDATIDSISLNTTNITEKVTSASNGTQTVTIYGVSTIFTPGTAFLPAIKLQMPLLVGTYTIGNNASAWSYTSVSGSAGSMATTGTITITSIENNISGNFSFVSKDSTVVQNGQFNCNYSK